MALAIGVVASRLTALPVKDERLLSIVFRDQLSNQFRRESFHNDHSGGIYYIQLYQQCNWCKFIDLKVLCSSAEAKTYLILELDPLGLPFLRGFKESKFAAFVDFIYLVGMLLHVVVKTPHTLTSVCIFSLLFSLNFLWYWSGEFV